MVVQGLIGLSIRGIFGGPSPESAPIVLERPLAISTWSSLIQEFRSGLWVWLESQEAATHCIQKQLAYY